MIVKSFLLCFAILATTTLAKELSCPQNTRGEYPKCVCSNGAVYDATYNWCASDLKELNGECPPDGPGVFPNCNCGLNKSFDKVKNVCTTVNRDVCPYGATGSPPNCQCEQKFAFDEVHWYCRPWYLSTTRPPTTHTYRPYVPQCGFQQYGTYPDCHYRPCPSNSLNPQDFEPHCRYNVTYVKYTPCPAGLVGSPPNCYKPCPAYHYGRYPDCQRIRCQTGPGWTGEFAPDCKYTPSCPPGFPGVWPYCDIYKATTEENTYLPPTTKSTPKPTQRTVSSTYLPPVTTPTRKPIVHSTYLPPVTTTPKPFVPSTYLPPVSSRRTAY